jgi:hypothetical protein
MESEVRRLSSDVDSARLRQGYGGQPSRFEGWLANRSGVSREGWWAWEDLNFRPHAYQARALTN